MDSERDGSCTTQGVQVKVSTKNCIKDGSIISSSVEDSNRNLTHFSNNKTTGEDDCASSKHSAGSLNGPNGLINGVDLSQFGLKICDCTVCKQSSKNSSSRCKSCVSKSNILDCQTVMPDVEVSGNSYSLNCEGSKINSLECDSIRSLSASKEVSHSEQCVSGPDKTCETEDTASNHWQASPSTQDEIVYVSYENEHQMPDIMRLIQKDLSEPYSIYTYRYFIHKWPQLCFLAMHDSACVGAIVCKLDIHRKVIRRGYIAMLAVDEKYRKRKIGTNLVLKAIRAMVADNADEIVLETEITNNSALRLYENLGFVRDKRLFRYYLNGVDALRLKLWLR